MKTRRPLQISFFLFVAIFFAAATMDFACAQSASAPKNSVKQNQEQAQVLDSANSAETVKSWTSESLPNGCDKSFLDSLAWEDHPLAGYVLRTGKIYGKWIAAMQFMRDGKLVLTEYTPPSEYVTVLDPCTGKPSSKVFAEDVNHDGLPEIAFLHQKLTDNNYHMYSVYSLGKTTPRLIWKSGGKFGDWLHKANQPLSGGTFWQGAAEKSN